LDVGCWAFVFSHLVFRRSLFAYPNRTLSFAKPSGAASGTNGDAMSAIRIRDDHLTTYFRTEPRFQVSAFIPSSP
jgi:hypothetical protein